MILALYPELLAVGGVQLAGRETAAALAGLAAGRGGYEFLSLDDPFGEFDLSFASREVVFRGFARTKVRYAFAAVRAAARGRPAVILAAHPHLAGPAVLARFFAPGARVAVMTHGIEVWQRLGRVRRAALCRADLVFAPSADTAQKLAAVQGVSPARIRRLPWPLDPEFAALAARSSSLARPADAPAGRIVLTVGRWSAREGYKGADHLIEALALLPAAFADVHLVAIGGGDDVPRLVALAAARGLAGRVHFLRAESRPALAAWYACAELFALPSGGEGFGLVFLEAMAFGKAVVGCDAGGIPDLVEDGANGLLTPYGDPPRLAAALARLLGDAELCRRLGAAGRARGAERHSFDAFARSLAASLDELALLGGDHRRLHAH